MISILNANEEFQITYIFDVWARMHHNDVAVLDPEVVAHNTIYPSAAIIQIVIGEDDEDGVFPLLALDQHCIASEQTKGIHGVV